MKLLNISDITIFYRKKPWNSLEKSKKIRVFDLIPDENWNLNMKMNEIFQLSNYEIEVVKSSTLQNLINITNFYQFFIVKNSKFVSNIEENSDYATSKNQLKC